MQIKINTTDVSSYLTGLTRSQTCRAENTVYTISGAANVDRMGGFKHTLSLTVGDITVSDWRILAEKLKALPVSVQIVESGGTTETYSMHLSAELPEPYVYTDSSGDHIVGASVTLEEL